MTQIGNKHFHNIAAAGETPIYKRTAGGFSGGLTLGTKQTFNSNVTAAELTNIPAGVTRINVIMNELRIQHPGSAIAMQIGDSGGYETTNYSWSWGGSAGADTRSSDFSWKIPIYIDMLRQASGIVRLETIDGYTWMMDFMTATFSYNHGAYMMIGRKTLSGNLDKIRLFDYTHTLGTKPIESGSINISYI